MDMVCTHGNKAKSMMDISSMVIKMDMESSLKKME